MSESLTWKCKHIRTDIDTRRDTFRKLTTCWTQVHLLASHDELRDLDNLRNTNRNRTSVERELMKLLVYLVFCLKPINKINERTPPDTITSGPELDEIIQSIDQGTASGPDLDKVLQTVDQGTASGLELHEVLQGIDQTLGMLDQLMTINKRLPQGRGIGSCSLYPLFRYMIYGSMLTSSRSPLAGSLSKGNTR